MLEAHLEGVKFHHEPDHEETQDEETDPDFSHKPYDPDQNQRYDCTNNEH